jgi:hypothetical protein
LAVTPLPAILPIVDSTILATNNKAPHDLFELLLGWEYVAIKPRIFRIVELRLNGGFDFVNHDLCFERSSSVALISVVYHSSGYSPFLISSSRRILQSSKASTVGRAPVRSKSLIRGLFIAYNTPILVNSLLTLTQLTNGLSLISGFIISGHPNEASSIYN